MLQQDGAVNSRDLQWNLPSVSRSKHTLVDMQHFRHCILVTLSSSSQLIPTEPFYMCILSAIILHILARVVSWVYCSIDIIHNYVNERPCSVTEGNIWQGRRLQTRGTVEQQRIERDWQIKQLKGRWLCHHFLGLAQKRCCYISYSLWMNE